MCQKLENGIDILCDLNHYKVSSREDFIFIIDQYKITITNKSSMHRRFRFYMDYTYATVL